MNEKSLSARRLRVVCVTPTGVEGRGGIDRLYGYLRMAGRPRAADGIDLRYFASRGGASGWRWIAAFPFRAFGFAALLARSRPDVVHINFATGGSLVRKLVLVLIARAARAAIVVHFHGDFPSEAIERGEMSGRLFTCLSRLADCVVVLGDVSRGRFIRHVGVPAARIRVVPNGIVDFASPGPVAKTGTGAVQILFAGELGERKGVAVLIAALGCLPPSLPWACTICGNGDVAHYERLAHAAGIADRLRFTGWAPIDAIHRMMQDADIVVLPSLAENMPLSLIEGTCAGAALVATPVTETRAILRDTENGLIVARDPRKIADALARLVSDRPALARMQARSREIYEQTFTIDLLADRLIAIYRELATR